MRIAIAFHSGSGLTRWPSAIVARQLSALGATLDCVDVEEMGDSDWQALAAADPTQSQC